MTSSDYLTKFHDELIAVWSRYRPQWAYLRPEWVPAPDRFGLWDHRILTSASNNATESRYFITQANSVNVVPKPVLEKIVMSSVEAKQRHSVIYLAKSLYKLSDKDLSFYLTRDKTQVWLGYLDPIEILDGFVCDKDYTVTSFGQNGQTNVACCEEEFDYDLLVDAMKLFVTSMKIK